MNLNIIIFKVARSYKLRYSIFITESYVLKH